MKRLWAALGLMATALGVAAIGLRAFAGAQPWDGELSDNFIFAKAIPFILGFGVLVGALRRTVEPAPRRADGAIRRFSPGTVIGHWVNALGFFLALITGSWQYLRGILEVDAPVPLYLFYRTHFIGATLILFSVGNFLTYWALGQEHPLAVPRGQWLRHLRGLAHELPSSLGTLLADLLGLDMKRTAPPVERFTYYEKTLSFPIWVVLIGLITVTGLIKAMRYVYPVPGEVLYWASGLHVATMVLIALKLLDHMRYVFARWPLLASMCTTWIGERYVQLRHPGWYKILGASEAEGEPAGTLALPSSDATRGSRSAAATGEGSAAP
jgi:cytochrome b subunit of formate dehydrogenase